MWNEMLFDSWNFRMHLCPSTTGSWDACFRYFIPHFPFLYRPIIIIPSLTYCALTEKSWTWWGKDVPRHRLISKLSTSRQTLSLSGMIIALDFSNNQDRKYWMKCCLIHEKLGCIYAHLVLEVGLHDLDNFFHISI